MEVRRIDQIFLCVKSIFSCTHDLLQLLNENPFLPQLALRPKNCCLLENSDNSTPYLDLHFNSFSNCQSHQSMNYIGKQSSNTIARFQDYIDGHQQSSTSDRHSLSLLVVFLVERTKEQLDNSLWSCDYAHTI